jgi:hypothetical protein
VQVLCVEREARERALVEELRALREKEAASTKTTSTPATMTTSQRLQANKRMMQLLHRREVLWRHHLTSL